jgi:hypothetical protein
MPNRELWTCFPPSPPHPRFYTTLTAIQTTDHEMIPWGLSGAVRETADYNRDYWIATGRSADHRETENTKHLDQQVYHANAFRVRNFYSSPPRNITHAQLMHYRQGSSHGLWTKRQIRSRVPVTQRFSASTIRSSKSFYLHTTQTTRDKRPCSKYSQCLNDRKHCASDLMVSRIYRIENTFWKLLNI